MPKTKKVPFPPWATTYDSGIEKRYDRLGATQMASEAMRSLTGNAFKIYWFMRIEAGGRKEFTFSNVKYRSYLSKPTFFKVVKELEDKGFIDVVQHNKNLRTANVYAFSERWKQFKKQ